MMLYEDLVEEVARASWGVAGPLNWDKLSEKRKEEQRLEAAAAVDKVQELMRNGAWPPIRLAVEHAQIIGIEEVSGAESA